jgi:hypothetical protein
MVYTWGLELKYIQGPHLDARELQIGREQNISADRRQGSNVTYYVCKFKTILMIFMTTRNTLSHHAGHVFETPGVY